MAERFGPLLGTWTGRERQEASPWAPATTTRASMVLKLDVDQTVVLQDYRQVRADHGELTGHGVFLLEPGTDRLLWWFFDSYARVPAPATGTVDDGELLVDRPGPSGSARHHLRVVGDQLEYRVGVRLGDATAHQPFLTGTYRRLTGH